MALFANDKEDTVDAWDAEPKEGYTCLECRGDVKLRKGKLQIPHFYHLRSTPSCRLYSKSERHLLIQIALQKQLPPGEAFLEKPFPSIHRIADVVWEKQKLVFEIQCSPISKEEAQSRHLEYASLGFSVIWILDDRLFNKRQLSSAEIFMRGKISYFVTGKGPFLFYDQDEQIEEGKRIRKGKRQSKVFSLNDPKDWQLRRMAEKPHTGDLKKTNFIKIFFQKSIARYLAKLDQWLYRK